MKETKFTRCFVNGKKACVISWENGLSVLGCFGTWAKNLPGNCWAELVRMRDETKEIASTRGMQDAVKIPSADLAGIQAVIPDAVVDWAGSKEYETRAAAAVGTRGGSSSGAASGAATVPAVAAPDAFRVPELSTCPVLSDLVGKMPPVVESLNFWAADYAAAMLAGTDAVAAPACIDQLGAFVPGIADAFKAYETIINNAVNDHREKLAAAEAARAAAAAAAAAAASAAANGKQLVTLENGSTVEVSGKVHAAFAETCLNVKLGIHSYIYGPAGTGKTYLCKQVAEALGLEFYSDQKVCNDYQLTGFIDAPGNFQETEFYRAFTRGGVYMLDEFDASDENAVTCLNSALANGYMTFPKVGRVYAHKNFHCVACGNTIGRGANSDYTGRNVLDAATLDRFAVVAADYDSEIELKIAGGDLELLEFIQAVRAAVKACGVSLVVSMRAIENITKVKEFRAAEKCLSGMLLKGLEKDQIALLANECKGNNKWFKALKALAA